MTTTTTPRARARPAPAAKIIVPEKPALIIPGAKAPAPEKGGKAELTGAAKVMADVQRVHGAHVMRQATVASHFHHIPTDIFTLDMALFGGLPRSMISMFYGWESGGKTTTGMRALGSAQRMFPNMRAAIIDAEGTFDATWSRRHGVDPEKLYLIQPETGEQALDIADALIRAEDISMVMVDSLPALVPAKELEKSMEDDIVAMQARLIGRFIRKVNQALLDERKRGHLPALLLINQWRSKIAFMGDTRNLPGGNALKFFVSARAEIMNKEILGKDAFDVEAVIRNEHTFKITKNKLGNGIRSGAFDMIRDPSHELGAGFIDEAETVVTYAKKFGIFSGGGAHWRFDDLDKKFGKMKEAVDYLYGDMPYFEALKYRLICMQRANAGLQAEGWRS